MAKKTIKVFNDQVLLGLGCGYLREMMYAKYVDFFTIHQR